MLSLRSMTLQIWARTRPDNLLPGTFPRSDHKWIERAALVGLLVFICGELFDPDIGRKGEWLLLLGALLSVTRIRRHDPGFWLYGLLLIFFIYMLAVNSWSNFNRPEPLDHLNYTFRYLGMFWFVISAWWLGGSERSSFLSLSLAAAIFVAIALFSGSAHWHAIFQGTRADFGFRNAQHTAVLAGSLILGLLTIGLRLLRPRHPAHRRVASGTAWLCISLLSALIFLGTQTRQAFLGLLAAIPVIAVVYLRSHSRAETVAPRFKSVFFALAMLALASGVVLALTTQHPVGLRTQAELKSVVDFIERGAQHDKPLTSITVRLAQWQHALQKIRENPLLGYGGATTEKLIKEAPIPGQAKLHFGHLHNSYLELWVAYGAAAPLLFVTLFAYLARRVLLSWRAGAIRSDTAAFGLSWITFFLVVNTFESYIMYRTGTYLILVVGGAIYSLSNPWRTNNPQVPD